MCEVTWVNFCLAILVDSFLPHSLLKPLPNDGGDDDDVGLCEIPPPSKLSSAE